MKRVLTIVAFLIAMFVVHLAMADSLDQAASTKEHDFLTRFCGRWSTQVHLWPSAADTHAVSAAGRSEIRPPLNNGQFILQTDSSRFGAKQYYDMAVLGYDLMKRGYVMSWADNRSSQLIYLTGAVNDSGNVLTLQGEREEENGGTTPIKIIYHRVTGSYHTMQLWEGASGKLRKVREIEYSRTK